MLTDIAFQGDKEKEAALYCLYMMADGEITYSEEKIFDAICKELNLDYNLQTIIGMLNEELPELTDRKSDMFSVIVSEKVDEAGEGWSGRRDPANDARIIWNLINLGYADTMYSTEEQRISKYLVDKWSVSMEIYQEFIDIADTMLALDKQKEWVLSTFAKGNERDRREKKIELEIERLLSDVHQTIEELTM